MSCHASQDAKTYEQAAVLCCRAASTSAPSRNMKGEKQPLPHAKQPSQHPAAFQRPLFTIAPLNRQLKGTCLLSEPQKLHSVCTRLLLREAKDTNRKSWYMA